MPAADHVSYFAEAAPTVEASRETTFGPGPRSLDVLAWLARIRVARPEPTRLALGLSRSALYGHAQRLIAAGWLTRVPTLKGETALLAVTDAGYRRLDRARRGREVRVRPHQWEHTAAIGEVAAWLGTHPQVRWWRAERMFGDHPECRFGIRLIDRGELRAHRPDLVADIAGRVVAVEVELSVKGKGRLDRILSAYATAAADGQFDQVLYLTRGTSVAAAVEQARGRVAQSQGVVRINDLAEVSARLRDRPAPTGALGLGGHPDAERELR